MMISLGEERIFRLGHPKTKHRRDFSARNGTVFLTPYDTNLAWKHAVPRFARWRGQRGSITIRRSGTPELRKPRISSRQSL